MAVHQLYMSKVRPARVCETREIMLIECFTLDPGQKAKGQFMQGLATIFRNTLSISDKKQFIVDASRRKQ